MSPGQVDQKHGLGPKLHRAVGRLREAAFEAGEAERGLEGSNNLGFFGAGRAPQEEIDRPAMADAVVLDQVGRAGADLGETSGDGAV